MKAIVIVASRHKKPSQYGAANGEKKRGNDQNRQFILQQLSQQQNSHRFSISRVDFRFFPLGFMKRILFNFLVVAVGAVYLSLLNISNINIYDCFVSKEVVD